MKKLPKIVIASRNPAKIGYYRDIFHHVVGTVLGLNDICVEEKPAEEGDTAEENAEIKGRYYSQITGLPVSSEDEALYVDFLSSDKQPGTKVRRICGNEEADDDKLLSYWETIVANVPENQRTGYWHIAYCFATPDGKIRTASLNHPIRFFSPTSNIRIPGWPMSSLQGPVRFGKPHSELTDTEIATSKEEARKVILNKLKEFISEMQKK